MKIKPSIRYQLHDQRLYFLVYYGVMVGMILLNLLFLPFAGGSDLRITSGGITAVTSIFFFIVGLCSFKEPFLLGLQHGISRRSQFLARLASMGIGCAFLALADEIYTLLVALLKIPFPNSFFAFSLYEMVYGGSTGTKLFLGLGPMDEATASTWSPPSTTAWAKPAKSSSGAAGRPCSWPAVCFSMPTPGWHRPWPPSWLI